MRFSRECEGLGRQIDATTVITDLTSSLLIKIECGNMCLSLDSFGCMYWRQCSRNSQLSVGVMNKCQNDMSEYMNTYRYMYTFMYD